MTKKYKMTTDIPASVTTPDQVETRLGKLKFFDGFPSQDTVEKCYDNLLFMRGVEVFLNWIPAASLWAAREGFREAGITRNGIIGIDADLKDSKGLFLTANMDSIYAQTWIDLRDGPIVVESPPNTLGIFNDFFFRYVADLGRSEKLNPESCGNWLDGHKPFFKAAESLKALFELSHGFLREFHAGFVDTVNLSNDRLL